MKKNKHIEQLLKELWQAPPTSDKHTRVNIEPESVEKRENDDPFHVRDHLEKYIGNFLNLRRPVAFILLALLCGEILLMFIILFLQGFNKISLDRWFIAIFCESVLIQTFFLVKEIVTNLFPRDFMDRLQGFKNKN